jgi:hypothetical protein
MRNGDYKITEAHAGPKAGSDHSQRLFLSMGDQHEAVRHLSHLEMIFWMAGWG